METVGDLNDADSSSDSNGLDQNTILRALLKVVEIRELPKWRLVNKFCNSVASLLMEHGSVSASIQDDAGMDRFLATMSSRRSQSLPFRSFSLSLGSITTSNILRFVELVGGAVDGFKFCDFLPEWNPYELLFFPEEVQGGFRQNEIQVKILSLLTSAGPTLRDIHLNADADISLTSAEVGSLPPEFPALTKVTVDYVCVFAEEEDDLLSVLIGRAPRLDSLGIKIWDGPNRDFNSRIPGFLYGIPRSRPPSLGLGTEITGEDREMVGRLVENGFNRLTHFILCFMMDDQDESLWRIVKPLLTLQSDSLEELVIQSFNHRTPFQLQLPFLQKLKTLVLSILIKEESCPIGQLTQGQFPVLEELSLYGAHSVEYRFLEGIVVPSLRKLAVWDYQGSAQEETFHVNFPHLTTLEVELKSRDLPFLEYAFTHLTGIATLELGSSMRTSGIGIQAELWNLYTGSQERVTKVQLLQEQGARILENPEPTVSAGDHRIFTVPSLANFTNLKELKVWARTTLEIEALVFMSRPGGLPVLDKFILGYRPFGNLEDDDEDEVDSDGETTVRSEWSPASQVEFPTDLPSEQSEISSREELDEYTEALTEVAEILEEVAGAVTEDDEDDVGDDEEELRVTIGLQAQLILPHRVTVAESGIDPDYISILENYHKNIILLMS